MSLCSGQIVYASLAQMSVKGAANSKLESLSVGMLDVFSSAFWTHPAYAHSVIRNCDEELTFSAKAAGVRLFQPPRSMDVIYNMFAVVDLPGLINVATINGTEYEVTAKAQRARRYSATIQIATWTTADGPNKTTETITGSDKSTQDLLGGVVGSVVLRAKTTNLTPNVDFVIGNLNEVLPLVNYGERPDPTKHTDVHVTACPGNGDYDLVTMNSFQWKILGTDRQSAVGRLNPANYDAWANDTASSYNPFGVGANETKSIEFILHGLADGAADKDIFPDTPGLQVAVLGSAFVCGDEPHYVDSVGQYLIRDVEMTIGGARVGLINSMYMYIHEELFGHPGRRQEESIGKLEVGAYEPEDIHGSGIDSLRKNSMVAQRLYVQLPWWWTGGRMERALKTIALQLHKIEFKVQTRKLEDCIAYTGSNMSGANVPSAGAVYEIVDGNSRAAEPPKDSAGNAAVVTIKTTVRANEHISPSANDHLIGAVRKNAEGGDVTISQRVGGDGIAASNEKGADNITSYLQVDFAGIFLNQTTRDTYLKLDEKTLFTQVLGTDTDGLSLNDTKTAPQTQTLNLSNAVYDIMVAVQSVDAGKNFGDTFGLRGTSMDATTGMRSDALETLSFDISSTPRTITNLSADYYRHITQYQAAKLNSQLKGLYYYNVALFDELNGTRCVNSFINASKIDDLRARYQVNNGGFSKTAANTDGRQLLAAGSSGCKIFFYAHVYNTIQFRNGMAGAMFA